MELEIWKRSLVFQSLASLRPVFIAQISSWTTQLAASVWLKCAASWKVLAVQCIEKPVVLFRANFCLKHSIETVETVH